MTLEEKIRDVLARLSVLSEASASSLQPRTSQSASDSKVPAGVRNSVEPTDFDKPPPKERSLFDWYAWHFAKADSDDKARHLQLYLLAERDYQSRVLHIPRRVALRSGEHTDAEIQGMAGAEAERNAAKRVIEWYEGITAEEVAIHEYTTVSWVHKARREHKRNPDDGRPRPPFLDWDDDERRRQIDLLRGRERAEGREIGAKSIGRHFGVDKNTVKRYLEPQAVAA